MKKRVLFVCIHNSARSQMAEAFLNRIAPERFEAFSAGLEPGTLSPLAVAAMRELGIDISGHATKSVFELFTEGERFDVVVTVCDETSGERCLYVPGAVDRRHWSFDDPASFSGGWEKRLEGTRRVRDTIRKAVEGFARE